MSGFDNPFDPNTRLKKSGCSCGRHHTQADHDADMSNNDARVSCVVKSAVMRGLFPDDQTRRAFLRVVGASTAMAAISTFFPPGAARALAAEAGKPEKTDPKIGFIPITCSTPIIMAGPMGFYACEHRPRLLHRAEDAADGRTDQDLRRDPADRVHDHARC